MIDQEQAEDVTRPHTVAAVFEDSIDGEHALVAIRKAGREAGSVSLVVVVPSNGKNKDAAVAAAVAAASMDDVGVWLKGLATVAIPGRGSFLVAGPLGAVVAGLGLKGAAAPSPSDGFQVVFQQFGFSEDAATYLDHRLAAGSPLVAVSTRPGESASVVRRLLADQNAVFIGTVETAAPTLDTAQELLKTRPEELAGGTVKVADAVGNLRRVGIDGGPAALAALLHEMVVDATGSEIGQVEDAFFEVSQPDGKNGLSAVAHVVRYVVVGHGGVMGLGRHRVAIPVAAIDLKSRPVSLTVSNALVKWAPALNDELFSRHEEQAVNDHFGVRPYWLAKPPTGKRNPAANNGDRPNSRRSQMRQRSAS